MHRTCPTFAATLAAGLARRGHDVHIVAPAASRVLHGTFFEEHGGETVTVHRLRSWRWRPHPWLRFALPWRIQSNSARILDAVQPDVVHFQSNMIVGRGLSKQAVKAGGLLLNQIAEVMLRVVLIWVFKENSLAWQEILSEL